MRLHPLFFASTFAAAALFAGPRPAAACGGTFCDGPTPQQPNPMPVDQTGENILFTVGGGRVDAHIQISVNDVPNGDPRRFAWLIPVQKVPEVRVGSQELFTNVLAASVPSFPVALSRSFDRCVGSSSSSSGDGGGVGCGAGGSDDSAEASYSPDAGGSQGAGGGSPTDPTVKATFVGAFEVDVLTGGTTEGVVQWLVDNNYQVAEKAPAIIESYLTTGHVFVALRLKAGAKATEVHPLVISYEGTEPCIPLRLTAIAAREDMYIRAFFLGQSRWVPLSYKHVTLNDAAFDWNTGGAGPGNDYKNVVGRAVDSPVADGRAFVTEWAAPYVTAAANPPGTTGGGQGLGTINRVRTTSGSGTTWAGATFSDPTQVVNKLAQLGLVSCVGTCTSWHALVFPLLDKWLPVPQGVSPDAFYGNLPGYAKQISPVWSQGGFEMDFQERIVQPAILANTMLDAHSYLTRLYTTISPSEMTEDPTFVEAQGLSDIRPPYLSTYLRTTCDLRQGIVFPSSRTRALDGQARVPDVPGAMPRAERVEQYDAQGNPTLLVDKGPEIDALLASENGDWPPAAGFSSDDRETSGCVVSGVTGKHAATAATAALGLLGLLRRRTRRKA